ncbi:L10-interacting MYB domain-containing protein-like [Rhododendron vialii]|uniref:L10-interacting MYB domain-containing protein-like n=1 Tax=Rhododendron vialii TaxID=182163 RepID=UPI00266031BB|nr:L10-interacting MYB domain-containing protein-like [Rhododendron vialii]
MVSPRGGRGIGIRTSPRKCVAQSSQLSNRNVLDRAKWTPSLTRCLLEACAEESDQYGRPLTGFSSQGWQRIVQVFAMKTGTMNYKKEQLKNKHDRLREEWKAWVLVAEDTSQTGLGRDPDTGAITGPEHWWAAMIARNSNVAKFKEKGLEHEELMARVFRDVTAMGNEAMFPGDGIDDIAEGFDESDGPRDLHGSVPHADDLNEITTPVSRKGKQTVAQMSKLGSGSGVQKRKFTETSDYDSGSIVQSLDHFKLTPSILINRPGRWGVDDCVKKIKTLPLFENEGENEDLFIWACSVFRRQQHKIDVFCEVKSSSRMIRWLQREHALAVAKYLRAPPEKRGLQPPPFPPYPPQNWGPLFPQGSAPFPEVYQPFPPSSPPFPPGYEAFRHESEPFRQRLPFPHGPQFSHGSYQ